MKKRIEHGRVRWWRRKPAKYGTVPRYKGVVVLGRTASGAYQSIGLGTVLHRQQMSANGRLGLGHKWRTSEEARAAARILWDKKWRKNRVIGVRIGYPAKKPRWSLVGWVPRQIVVMSRKGMKRG